MNTRLLHFYLDLGPDDRGRMLQDILAWQDPKEWEKCHDFIQWVFPLPEPSQFNTKAPLLDDETREAFMCSDKCMHNAAQAYLFAQRFLWQKGVTWLTPMNHNHLRITRIIRFLNLIGYGIAARNVYFNVTKIARRDPSAVSQVTLDFWKQAMLPDIPEE